VTMPRQKASRSISHRQDHRYHSASRSIVFIPLEPPTTFKTTSAAQNQLLRGSSARTKERGRGGRRDFCPERRQSRQPEAEGGARSFPTGKSRTRYSERGAACDKADPIDDTNGEQVVWYRVQRSEIAEYEYGRSSRSQSQLRVHHSETAV